MATLTGRMERTKREIEHNKANIRDRGFRRVNGWDADCPRYPGRDSMGGPFYDWEDHCYMLKHREVPTIYVSEPYVERVQGEAFSELADLVKDGWHVQISEGLSLHNPGRTLPIWITWDNKSTDHELLDVSRTNCDRDCEFC